MDEDILGRLMWMVSWPVVFVNQREVNSHDVIDMRPGSIIRCNDNPNMVVWFMPIAELDAMGCVAGWISEEA